MRNVRNLALLFALALLVSCAPPCGRDPPSTMWDRPLCTDTELDTSLLDNATHGDPSALELLQKRFETAFTIGERHHIAALLLHVAPDDRPYWNELNAYAENAVRFSADDSQLATYCSEHECEPERYMEIATRALGRISEDARSRSLLHQVIESDQLPFASIAITGLGVQHDESSLDAIDRMLSRHPEEAPSLARSLAAFGSEAADRVAGKYLPKEEWEDYRAARKGGEAGVQ